MSNQDSDYKKVDNSSFQQENSFNFLNNNSFEPSYNYQAKKNNKTPVREFGNNIKHDENDEQNSEIDEVDNQNLAHQAVEYRKQHIEETKIKELRNKFKDMQPKKETEVSRVKRYQKIADLASGILAILSSIVVYFENENFYNEEYDSAGKITKLHNKSSSLGDGLRTLNILLTILLCISIYLRYNFQLKLLKLKRLKLPEDDFRSAGMLWWLLLELFYCGICCPPRFDYSFHGTSMGGTFEYSYDALTLVITLGKSYLLIRVYSQYSKWTSDRAIKICKRYKIQATIYFAMKAEMKRRPFIMIGILMLATMIYVGFAMRTLEISYVHKKNSSFDWKFLANSFWVVIITMTTVGFGEGYPSTHLGRMIGFFACIIGMLLVSLIIVSLTVQAEFTPEEAKAFFLLKKIYAKDNIKDKAGNVIKSLFRYKKTIKKKTNVELLVKKFILKAKLIKSMSIFKSDFTVANSDNMPVDELLKNLHEKLENNLEDLNKEVENIDEIQSKCEALKVRQTNIDDRLSEIVNMQTAIANFLINANQQKTADNS